MRSATPAMASSAYADFLPAIAAINVDNLRVDVARSREEVEAAQGLVHRRYRWRGYETSELANPSPAADAPAAASREVTIVAAGEGGMIGTCTLGFDGPGGLRADASYGDVIRAARAAGRRVGEITRLAIDSADSKAVLASLFNLAFVRGHGQLTDVYLLGLAKKMGGRLATFDRSIPLKAVVGCKPDTLDVIGPA